MPPGNFIVGLVSHLYEQGHGNFIAGFIHHFKTINMAHPTDLDVKDTLRMLKRYQNSLSDQNSELQNRISYLQDDTKERQGAIELRDRMNNDDHDRIAKNRQEIKQLHQKLTEVDEELRALAGRINDLNNFEIE